VLLLALALLACWRPVFLLGFAPLLLAGVFQFEYSLEGFSWTDKNAPLLFLAWFVWLYLGARATMEGRCLPRMGLYVAYSLLPDERRVGRRARPFPVRRPHRRRPSPAEALPCSARRSSPGTGSPPS
jgi:hypothetical protein